MRRAIGVLLAILVCGSVAMADQLKKSDKELGFTFSYSDISPDQGDDLSTTVLDGFFGWLLTDHHEVGGLLTYTETEVGNASTDSSAFGVFYDYNFQAGTNLNPYVGGHYQTIGGDQGDFLDSRYGLRGGIKIYPWSNGGFNFGLSWDQFTGADNFGDADGTTLFGGVLIKIN